MFSALFGRVHEKFAQYGDDTLSLALVGVGVGTIVIAIFNHNVLFKAGLLAYEILP